MTIRVWVCQVRREVFVGGESQRCRHTELTPPTLSSSPFTELGCGEMELIGGEPVEWCVSHESQRKLKGGNCDVIRLYGMDANTKSCQFESQIRVGP